MTTLQEQVQGTEPASCTQEVFIMELKRTLNKCGAQAVASIILGILSHTVLLTADSSNHLAV